MCRVMTGLGVWDGKETGNEMEAGIHSALGLVSSSGEIKPLPLILREGTVVACVKKHGLQVSEVSALFFSSM